MFEERNKQFLDNLITNSETVEGDEGQEMDTEQPSFADIIIDTFNEQMASPIPTTGINVVESIVSSSIIDKYELLENIFEQIVSKFSIEYEDIDYIKSDYERLLAEVKMIYASLVKDFIDFSSYFCEVMITSNTDYFATIFEKELKDDDLRHTISAIKKNNLELEKGSIAALLLCDILLKDETTALMSFGSSSLLKRNDQDEYLDHSIMQFLRTQDNAAFESIINHLFSNSLAPTIVSTRIKRDIMIAGQETDVADNVPEEATSS